MAEEKKGFAALFGEMDAREPARGPSVGDSVSGLVVAVDAATVFVDVGAKAEAILERSQLDGETPPKVGDRITAFVVSKKADQILLQLRLGRGQDTSALQRAMDAQMPVMGKITGVNKGGLEVDVNGARAFCPLSQMDIARVEDPSGFVGQELEFRVTRYEDEGGGRVNIVLSRRVLLEAQRSSLAKETLARLELGAIVRGKVSRIKEFGAFVDLGGLEGLLHKSELGFGRNVKVENVVSIGDVVDAQVTKIEPSNEPGRPDRVSLSLKALQKDPLAEVGSLKGTRRRGKITKIEAFGAFVDLGDGLEGLVHVSELSDKRVNHPKEVVSVGAEVDVVVLDVDQQRRRVALSIKQVASQDEAAQAKSFNTASPASLGTFGDLMKKKLKG